MVCYHFLTSFKIALFLCKAQNILKNDLVYISLHVVCVKYSEKSNVMLIVPYWFSCIVNWWWLGKHGIGWEDMMEGAGGHWVSIQETR